MKRNLIHNKKTFPAVNKTNDKLYSKINKETLHTGRSNSFLKSNCLTRDQLNYKYGIPKSSYYI